MSASATGAQPNGSANKPASEAKSRTHNDGSSSRAFTVEQKAAVIRVRKCKTTAFYDILGLQEVRTTCTDGDIKKAYRKLSLLTHPDKNGYTGADEAFKMVSRAFQILSDPDKKSQYDKFGTDPENRFASAAASNPFSSFARGGGGAGARPGGAMFEEEISPEELFRQFFGGGMGGPFGGGMGGFGGFGGPGFVFNMGGGPGVRIHQFGGEGMRRRPHNHAGGAAQPNSPWEAIRSLMPLLLLFILPLLSNLFSSLASSAQTSASGPNTVFDAPAHPHTHLRTSDRLQIPYYVNPDDVTDYTIKKWRELDKVAEGRYVGKLNRECEWELNQRQRLINEANGFLFADYAAIERARRMDMPRCRRYQELTGQRVYI